MKSRLVTSAAGLAGAVVLLGQFTTADQHIGATKQLPGEEEVFEGNQPDVIVWSISGLANWNQAPFRAYSVGTTSCNEGNATLTWNGSNNQHPVIGQSMYRVAGDGSKIEQIGQSWLKHGFCALDFSDCGPCQGTGCGSLGIDCSDPYTASRNGSQSPAGPKWQVNATNGFFPYPPANPGYSGQTARRLQVLQADVDPSLNPGARYFIEAQYVHPQDCPEDNDSITISGDNSSYREVSLASNGSATGYIGGTVRRKVGLEAWKAVNPDVTIVATTIPGEGHVYVGYLVTDNNNGRWDYEYAVQNQDFDRSIGGVSVPVDDSLPIVLPGFHDVDYHSGEPQVGTDWDRTHVGNELAWASETFSQNTDGNAIRWGTLYNFRFTTTTPPTAGTITLDVFKPGSPSSINVGVQVPTPPVTTPCPGDTDDDGDVDFDDLVTLLSSWGSCPGCSADLDDDNDVDFDDLIILLAAWGPCP